MGIIAIWKHLTEQSRASSPCLEVAFRILLAGDPYIWCVQRGGVETHGKQVLYVRGTLGNSPPLPKSRIGGLKSPHVPKSQKG